MAVDFDRGSLRAHWAGNGVSAIDEETTVHLRVALRGTGADDVEGVATVIEALLAELNGLHLDWDDEVEVGSYGLLSIPLPSSWVIGVRSPTWGEVPDMYLEAFCAALTRRGWSGRLDLHREAARVWVPHGPEATITTMLGYERGGPPADPWSSPWVIWQDVPELRTHLAGVALDWIDTTDAPLTYISDVSWQPTREQALELLDVQLRQGRDRSIEVGRLAGDSDGSALRPGTRTGRTAVFSDGYLVLTENDQHRSLADRLADHHAVLAQHSRQALYGLTTGTVGHTNSAKSVYGHRAPLRFQEVTEVPHQRPGYGRGLPDIYFAQAVSTGLLDSTPIEPSKWRREDLPFGLTLLTARQPDPWFTSQPAPGSDAGTQTYLDASAEVLADARASLGELLQRPLDA